MPAEYITAIFQENTVAKTPVWQFTGLIIIGCLILFHLFFSIISILIYKYHKEKHQLTCLRSIGVYFKILFKIYKRYYPNTAQFLRIHSSIANPVLLISQVIDLGTNTELWMIIKNAGI